jgi:hypothetical protein
MWPVAGWQHGLRGAVAAIRRWARAGSGRWPFSTWASGRFGWWPGKMSWATLFQRIPPSNSLFFILVLFHVISNTPSSNIQIRTLLMSKKFQILHGVTYIQLKQLYFWEEVHIPNRILIKNIGSRM